MRDSTPHTVKAHSDAGEAFAALLHSDSADLEPVAADLARAGRDVTRPNGAVLLADVGGGTAKAETAADRFCAAVYGAVRCPVQPAPPPHVPVVVPALAPGLWFSTVKRVRDLACTHDVLAVAVAPVTGLDVLRSQCRRAVADLAVAVIVLERPQLVDEDELVVWRMLADLDNSGQHAALAPLARVLALPRQTRRALLRAAEAVFVRGDTYEDAARKLHIHPNTLRYRVDRLAELTGMRLHRQNLPTVVRLNLALRLLRLRVEDTL